MSYTKTNWQDYPNNTSVTAARMNNIENGVFNAIGICTSSTRPASPFAGQRIYETDTKKQYVWNGSVWSQDVMMPTGSVLQVQRGTTSTEVSTTSTSRVSTGLSATITPRFTSSSVLIIAQISTRRPTAGNAGIGFDIRRNGTVVMNHTNNYYLYNSADVSAGMGVPLMHLDSPNSIASLTYTVFFASYSGSQVDVQDDGVYPSNIVLMEIAA